MKVIILAGGLGTRISEETHLRPKPMIEIGGKPLLWHIMKHYSHYGFNEFIVCGGYKCHIIKEYFANYYLRSNDISIDLRHEKPVVEIQSCDHEPWRITIIDSGSETQTAGRLLYASRYITGDTFCLTYGDGLSDVDMEQLVKFHHKTKKLATLTAVNPPGRYGALALNEWEVKAFSEKTDNVDAWINGGFFVMSRDIFRYIESNQSTLESDVLPKLAKDNQLGCYKHNGFWKAMDTLRDMRQLENLWAEGAPWKIWS